MISAMTAILFILALAAAFASLVHYARHDRFAGPALRTSHYDNVGRATSGTLGT
jgi:hypothetical protein